ncbi:MAG TPA: DUF4232 domain-containing protein [Acidimicrobiales bacterium]|nr:DUF4232 domain-containing protein [Acidimicrobiales bacterium]
MAGARAAGGVAVVAAALLSGCSSSPVSTAGTTTTTRAPTSTTSTPLSTTSSSAPSTTTTVAGTVACSAAQLQMTPRPGSGAAGTIELSVAFVNISGRPCLINGYPGMELLAAGGSPLPTNVVRGGGPGFPGVPGANAPPSPFVLAPEASAAFSLAYEDVPVGTETSCPTSAQAEITPPNALDHDAVNLTIAPCGGGTIHVSPVYMT